MNKQIDKELLQMMLDKGYSPQQAQEAYYMIGGSILNKLIDNLPFELHYVSPFTFQRHNFSGPGTKYWERVDHVDAFGNPVPHEWSKPKNKADEASMYHDYCYDRHDKFEDRQKCDDQMIEKLREARKDKNDNWKNRADAAVLEGIMRTKRFFGMAEPQKNIKKKKPKKKLKKKQPIKKAGRKIVTKGDKVYPVAAVRKYMNMGYSKYEAEKMAGWI